MVWVAACKDNADVVKKYRPQAEARMAEMTAALEAAYSAGEPPAPAVPEKLTLMGDHPNAALVHSSWFTGESNRESLLPHSGDVYAIKDALGGRLMGVPKYYEQAFKSFLGLKYLVVVDIWLHTGVITGEHEFTGGGASGSLMIVDIKNKKNLGVLPISAQHGDKITVYKGSEERSMHSDLWTKARSNANDALAPFLAAGEKPAF